MVTLPKRYFVHPAEELRQIWVDFDRIQRSQGEAAWDLRSVSMASDQQSHR